MKIWFENHVSSSIIFWFLFLVLFFVSHLNLVVKETVQIPWICQAQVSLYSNDNVLRAKEKEEVRRSLQLQVRRNDRKLLKTVSKCSHSNTYANSFPGCNFLFSFRTSTLLLLIKDEEPSGHSDLSKRRFTDREENYFFFHSKNDL